MSLVSITLQNKIYNIFNRMNKIYSNGNEYMATEIAQEITSYIAQGEVNTVDVGTGSHGGAYGGVGKGSMSINTSLLKNYLSSTFLSKSNNYELARRMAKDIDTVCSMGNTIITSTKGVSVISSSDTYSDSGVGKGSFSSSSNIIYMKLKNCFDYMNKMTKNGNLYFAQEFAQAIDEYLKSGTINVTLQAPLGGGGIGTIS